MFSLVILLAMHKIIQIVILLVSLPYSSNMLKNDYTSYYGVTQLFY